MPHSVCLITGEYPPAVGGVADYTALLAGELREQGHTVVVVAGAPVVSSHEGGVDARVPVRHVDGWGLISVLHLARFLRTARVDLIHLQYQAAPFNRSPLLHLLPALLRGMGVSARFVTTFHDLRPPYLFPKAGALRRRAVDFLVGRSDGAIFTDPEDLLAVGRSDGTAWIPIGANVEPGAPPDRDAARARWGFSAHDRVLTYFGFLNVSKGAENVLHVLAQLIERGVPARALFIGHEHGSSDVTNRETAARTRRQSAELGLADRVTWTGWLPPEGVSQALWTADVAVLPYIDGASLRRGSFLACLAHGVPVVTTRPRSWPELPARVLVGSFSNPEDFRIGDHVAELVDADESGALLAEAVGRVLEDQGRAHELSAAGRELVGRLSWGAIGAATTEFYERVLGAPARTAAGS